MIPHWLTMLSILMLVFGGLCSLVILCDLLLGNRQHMFIMNIVWPVVATFGTAFALYAYFKWGKLATHQQVMAAKARDETPPHQRLTPFPVMVGKGASHCGSGCTLGDICAEWLAVFAPVVAVWFGYQSIFPDKILAVWIIDYLFAFGFGVAFQYFTIKPMRGLSVGQGLIQAVKADVLSLTAWQVGMYGWMAIAHYLIFAKVFHHKLHAHSPEFWFMMQIAMLLGFATAYPVNWWLIQRGIKEKM